MGAGGRGVNEGRRRDQIRNGEHHRKHEHEISPVISYREKSRIPPVWREASTNSTTAPSQERNQRRNPSRRRDNFLKNQPRTGVDSGNPPGVRNQRRVAVTRLNRT